MSIFTSPSSAADVADDSDSEREMSLLRRLPSFPNPEKR